MTESVRFPGIRTAGLFFFMIFAFTVFISKAAVNITSGVVLFFAILDMLFNRSWKDLGKNRFFLAFLIPLALGLVLSCFSDAGLKGPGFFMERYRFLFLFIPFMIFIRQKPHLLSLFFILCASGSASALFSFFNADQTGSSLLFEGLHIVGRNSDLFTSLGLMSTVLLFHLKGKDASHTAAWRAGALITLGLCVASVVFINQHSIYTLQRGALLGLCVGWFFYALFFNRKILLVLAVLSTGAVMTVGLEHPLVQRIKSIGDVKNDISNLQRLHLWGSGITYVAERHLLTGVGTKKPDKDYTDFFKQKDKSFQEKYNYALENAGNFHNSYLQMAAENGALFLLIYLGGLFGVLAMMAFSLKDDEYRMFRIAALTVSAAASVTYFFHGELYRYGGIVFYLVLLGGCVHKPPAAGDDRITDPGQEPEKGPVLYGASGPLTPAP